MTYAVADATALDSTLPSEPADAVRTTAGAVPPGHCGRTPGA